MAVEMAFETQDDSQLSTVYNPFVLEICPPAIELLAEEKDPSENTAESRKKCRFPTENK